MPHPKSDNHFGFARWEWNPVSSAFWALILLLAAAFVLGGSARGDVASLMVLRPLAAGLLGFAVWQLRFEQVKQHRLVAAMALAVVALPVVQLVPLPEAIWSHFPGRQQVVDIDRVAELGKIARPLSLVPDATLNALISLVVPLAALALGIQLDRKALERLLPVLLGLIGVSALFALMQTLGGSDGPLYFYDVTNRGSAVGLLANRNHQAVLLAMAIPMLALLASRTGDNRAFLMAGALIAVLVLLPLILVTGSRAGAIVGLFALLSVGLVIPLRTGLGEDRRVNARKLTRIWPSAAAGAALLALGLIGLTVYLGRADAINRLAASLSDDDLRFRIIPTVAEMFLRYWPAGTGLGSFEAIFQANEPDALLGPVYMNHAHNDWLETGLTGGLPGIFLLFVATVGTAAGIVRTFMRRTGQVAPDRFARVGLILIALAGIASLSDYPLRTPLFESVFIVAVLWASCPLPRYETIAGNMQNHSDIGCDESNQLKFRSH